MGQPTNFDGCNVIMRAPEGAENVQDMHVFRTRHSCVSCWELSADELAEVKRTGRVFLSVLMGGQQPPVYVGSETACREVLVDFGPVWPKAPLPPAENVAAPAERYRHKKRGSTYTVLQRGRLQVDGDLDMEKVVVYRADNDGSIWVRPEYEFSDGRFEALASSEVSPDA